MELLFHLCASAPLLSAFCLAWYVDIFSVNILLYEFDDFYRQNRLCLDIAYSCLLNVKFFRIRTGYDNVE
jgi:hypothetical protein